MRHNNDVPGSRLAEYVGGAVGLFRAADQVLTESRAPSEEIDPKTSAELTDVNAKAIWIAGIGTLVGIWAIVLVLYPLFTYYKYDRTGGKDPSKVLTYIPPLPPLPRNEVEPHLDVLHFRASEESILNNYRWVDRSRGVVRIPIDEAIRILAQRGVPPSQPGGTRYYPPSAGSMSTGFEGKVRPQPR